MCEKSCNFLNGVYAYEISSADHFIYFELNHKMTYFILVRTYYAIVMATSGMNMCTTHHVPFVVNAVYFPIYVVVCPINVY